MSPLFPPCLRAAFALLSSDAELPPLRCLLLLIYVRYFRFRFRLIFFDTPAATLSPPLCCHAMLLLLRFFFADFRHDITTVTTILCHAFILMLLPPFSL